MFMNECIDSTMGRIPRMLAVLLASDDPRTSWSFQADILTKALPRETFVRCIANALKPDDILPPIAQNEGEC